MSPRWVALTGLAAALVLPLDAHWLERGIEPISIPALAGIAGAATIGGFLLALRGARSPARWALVLGTFFSPAYCAAAPLFATVPSRVSLAFALYLLLGLAGALLGNALDILRAFALAATAQGAVCLVQSALGRHGIHSGDLFRPSGTFNDVSVVSMLLALAMPVALGLTLRRPSAWNGVALALVGVALTLTWTRATMLGAAGGVLAVTVAHWPSRSRRPFMAAVCLLVIAATALCFAGREANPLREASTRRSDASRRGQWAGGWRYFVDHPLGGGPGNVTIYHRDRVPDGRIALVASANPKNQALMTLDTFGVAGGIASLMAVAGLGVAARRSWDSGGVELAAAFATLFVLCGFDNPFFTARCGFALGPLGLLLGAALRLEWAGAAAEE